MKYLITILLTLSLSIPGIAQIVSTDPAFPATNKSVTIFFDATEGSGGLEDFTGDVYAHTGVITDQSTTDSDWKYVIADWGVNPDKIKLERLEPNLYKLEISPSIAEYYSVPEGETVQKMAFVFRNSDGSREAKAEGGNDILVEVYEAGITVRFDTQNSYQFGTDGETITLRGIASDTSSAVTLSLLDEDNNELASVQNDTLLYDYTATAGVKTDLKLVGSLEEAADTANYFVITPSAKVDTDRPANLEDGITIVDDNTIHLSLFAPHKEFAYLIGDFNNWEPHPDYEMNVDVVDENSQYFWLPLENLSPDEQYVFQYFVDGEIRVADPYSELVLDPSNDQYIPEETFPNLKPYPSGKTDFAVSLVQTVKEEYEWEVTDFERPAKDELVIYELLIRDFVEARNYQTLIDTLDYLDRLGINAIEFMPVNEFDGNLSWGYNPAFHMALDKAYGTPNAFRKFVDEAHKRGIAVIIDVVYNHATGSSPLIRLWNEGDYGRPTSENPYANVTERHPYNVFNDLNHESEATKYWLDRANAYWLEEYNIDGYRFDLTKGFTQVDYNGDVGAWSGYDASRVALLKRMVDRAWEVDDTAYMIFEHLGSTNEENELSNYGIMLWGKMTESYNEATMGYNSGGSSNFSGIYHTNRGFDLPHLIGYMESHDEERLMYKNEQFGAIRGEYSVREQETALERMEAAGAFLFLVPGPKMLWQFGELGYDYSINYPTDTDQSRTGEKPIRWDYLENESRVRLYKNWSALINLRMEASVFHDTRTNVQMFVGGAMKEIYFSYDNDDETERAYVVGNFSVDTRDITPGLLEGTYKEFFTGDTLETDTEVTMTLLPGEFRVYTSEDYGIAGVENLHVTPIEDDLTGNQQPVTTQLKQNYPNPFNPTTTIPFAIEQSGQVSLKVYNMIGQEVATLLENQSFSAGQHQVGFDASEFSSGVYLIQMRTGAQSFTRKMTLMK
jgi:1,4-alpha-glucan branching enzyme